MTTSEIRKLFAEGKYSRSLSEIEASLQHPEVMLTEQLILQNNKELCQIMMPHCDHYTKLKEVRNRLHVILDNCASVPVGRDILQIELVVLYNHVATVACTTLETPPAELETSPRSPPYSSCVQTLLRVYRLLHPSDYPSVRMKLPACDRTSCYTIMDQCLDRLALPTGSLDLLWSVALCCCMLALVEMLLGNTEQARRTLQKLKGILKIQAGIETEVPTSSPPVGLHMPLQLEPNVVHPCRTNCVDVCNFILGLCDFKDGRWDECTQSMKAVKCTEMADAVKYLKGMCLLRMEKYSDALPVLSDLAASSSLTQTYQAQMYNTIGNCLSKMNKPQLAIQMYKEALEADFGSLSPLYNIAVQYRELGTRNTELECLHSLVMALSSESAAPSDVSASPCVDLYRLVDLGNDDITYPQALYTLAQQYARYDRHKEASISYMDVITHLTSEMDTSQVTRSAGLPPVTQIYHETMQSLLEATKYTDCIAVCDRALLCFHNNSTDPNSTYDKSENDGCLSDHDCDFHVSDIDSSLCDSSRKRKRCSSKRLVSDESSCHRSQVLTDECHVNSWVDSLDKDIVTLQCKSKALLKLGDLQGARECLQSAVDSVEAYRMKTFQTAATYSQLSPPNKRQRHDNTGNNNGSVTHDNQHANNVKPEEADPVSHVESDLYFCLGSTLEELGQLPDAIHCYRLAAQLTPGEVRIMYRCTQTLLAMNQTRQAVTNWLSYRNMPLLSNYIKMKSQLEAKRKLVKSADSGLPSEEKHLTEMDITCLEYAMKYHQ